MAIGRIANRDLVQSDVGRSCCNCDKRWHLSAVWTDIRSGKPQPTVPLIGRDGVEQWIAAASVQFAVTHNADIRRSLRNSDHRLAHVRRSGDGATLIVSLDKVIIPGIAREEQHYSWIDKQRDIRWYRQRACKERIVTSTINRKLNS